MRVLFVPLLACSACVWAQDSGPLAVPDRTVPSSQSAGQAGEDRDDPRSSDAPAAASDAPPSDSSSPVAPVARLQTPPPAPEREVSWLKLAGNVERDQRALWTAPLKLKDRKYWLPTAAVLVTTAGLMALDAKEGHYFRNSQTYNTFNNIFEGQNTGYGLWVAPFALYGAGLFTKDSKMKSTALLAGEAVIDSEILTTVLKDIDRRKRPQDFKINGDFSNSWFQGNAGGLQGNGSFPSGHTIAAFSIATVIARRYANHKWAPYLAYGTAAVIGFSRLTTSSHWGSDVFVGGVLGYTIARFDVLRQ